jgi:UDP-glucose:(heptosyl)LPS alpha-1,3-glucosyltransferase
MRVAIVQEQVDTSRGGAETSTLEMARHLAALGVDVTVVCTASDEATERRGDEGVRLHRLVIVGGSRVARTVRFVAEADRYCREEAFDVVHAVTPCFSCGVYQPRGGTYVETVERSIARSGNVLARLIKRAGRRFNRRQRFLLLAEREILSSANPPHVACVSEYVHRQVAVAFAGLPAERNRVVFNGVGLEPLSPEAADRERELGRRRLRADEQTSVVLFAAHNFKLKGLGELLRALRETPGSNGLLAVVGRGETGGYRRLADRLRPRGRVEFVGPVADVRPFYYGADVLAHPTWYDPCSRVVLEALVCGLPVVTTRLNGAAEVIEAGRTGVVIDSPSDAGALAAAIESCLRPEVRTGCRAVTSLLREQLSMARHARELKALYEEVAANRSRRRRGA